MQLFKLLQLESLPHRHLSPLIVVKSFMTPRMVIYVNFNNDNLLTSLDYKVSSAAVAEGDLNFSITGTAGADTITSGDGADTILGGTGADSIVAGGGNDVVTGGAGIDTINIGTGTAHHPTATAANRDVVTGFTVGTDVLGLVAALTSDSTDAGDAAVVEAELLHLR